MKPCLQESVRGADDIGFKSDVIERCRELLALPTQKYLEQEQDAALRVTKNYRRAIRISMARAKARIEAAGGRQLNDFSQLKTPEEFAQKMVHVFKGRAMYKETMLKARAIHKYAAACRIRLERKDKQSPHLVAKNALHTFSKSWAINKVRHRKSTRICSRPRLAGRATAQ